MNITETGNGCVEITNGIVQLTVPSASRDQYSNAQIADYRTRQDFLYKPPVRMMLNAYASGELQGTAGFGFWNHPFAPGERGFYLPQSAWFFHASQPNNMALVKGIPGAGWKAATFNAARWQFLTLLPTAPVGFLLMRIPAVYDRLWEIGQRALGVSEYLLESDLLKTPHRYVLDWLPEEIRFEIDGVLIHRAPSTIKNNLGFIAWVDNQYAIVTPQGQFGAGLVEVSQPQALILSDISIAVLPDPLKDALR